MRIVSVSDLHLDHTANGPVVAAMLEQLASDPPDVLVVAGDVASNRQTAARTLERLVNVGEHVLFVPGNHDLWAPWREVASGEVDTWRFYREELFDLCRKLGIHYLPASPVTIGSIGFAGVTGWYDYSLATRVARFFFDDDAFRRGYQGGYAWVDPLRTSFQRPDGTSMADTEVTRVMASDLEAHLRALPPHASRVVAVTHVVPFAQAIQSRPFLARDFFTAFLGSKLFGEVLLQDPRVKVSVCGHTHTPVSKRVGRIQLVCTPLGYPREWRGDPRKVAKQRRGEIIL